MTLLLCSALPLQRMRVSSYMRFSLVSASSLVRVSSYRRFSLVSASSLVQYLDYFDNARAAQLLAVAIREPPLCVCVRT